MHLTVVAKSHNFFFTILFLYLQLIYPTKQEIIFFTPGHRAFQQASNACQDLHRTQCHFSAEP